MSRPGRGSSPIRCPRANGSRPATRPGPCYGRRRWRWADWAEGNDMLLMIDNYDSFTYNLVQYFGELGADVRVYRNDEITVEEAQAIKPDHIVISPGPCTPNEAGISVPLIKAMAGKVPIIAVCLGHQSIGQAFGARML